MIVACLDLLVLFSQKSYQHQTVYILLESRRVLVIWRWRDISDDESCCFHEPNISLFRSWCRRVFTEENWKIKTFVDIAQTTENWLLLKMKLWNHQFLVWGVDIDIRYCICFVISFQERQRLFLSANYHCPAPILRLRSLPSRENVRSITLTNE